ncbi:putative SP-containing protein [Vairimorpha necatrix]|uniref:SP-containing protein n=1 Tax=Vairimorpha necatrix TaxID=6039 RepID=A0AAX4JGS9_9MICR
MILRSFSLIIIFLILLTVYYLFLTLVNVNKDDKVKPSDEYTKPQGILIRPEIKEKDFEIINDTERFLR